ncbi:MAG: hypothetical protein Q9218_002852 [Villophora microphyllina]
MAPDTYTITAPPKPGLTPPPGVTPNFEQPYTLLPYVELTIAGGIGITTFLVVARVFVKLRLMKKWLWEDTTCLFGWLSNYSDMLYCLAIAFVKLSILLLITRIFLSVRRNILFWLTQLLIWVNTLFYAIAFFLAIFGCRPRSKIWKPDVPGQCFDSKSLYIASASFNAFSDIAMLLVVVHMVFGLQMSLKRKVGITAIFGTGVFIVRIYFEIKLTRTADFTYVHQETGLLGYAEVACGIICACLPILPLAWHHLSRSTGGGDIALGPMHRSPQCTCHFNHKASKTSTRAWSEATDGHHEPVKGKNWVRLEDGTIQPVPKAFHGEREGSDEQALTAAIAGV